MIIKFNSFSIYWKLIASSQSESRGNLHFINRRFLLTRKEEPCNNDSIYRAIVRMSCVWLDMFRCMNNAELVTFNERVFRIRKRLGEGAFSFVYLVQERSTGKLYAMKRIVCHDAVEQRNVENEVKLYELLDRCPNVISCEDFSIGPAAAYEAAIHGQGDELSCDKMVEINILLPYYKRGTIQDELDWRKISGDFMAETRLLSLFNDICNGLNALHSLTPQPYAHRPANVLLNDDDSAVLMDLGSARLAEFTVVNECRARQLQDYAAEHCSMYYRAPELFAPNVGDKLDERSDIWSLGCLLYALCFWESPFEYTFDKGDSLMLAVLSANYRIPTKSP
ncbi:Serine/threonine-protein kinase 16 [Trichinella pseudospiralis]|uniref:non-specific serine/threonine protein kinase n=1 Tax=Trichinella pseudospiralis TaxID=6337 RepID=A0A0V1JH72_TRIPS|nr:Serine/threonine-protein kinase 16 [Trichinella pseudospiralis]